MEKLIEMQCGAYYMIESMATARSCYFESNEEIEKFRTLFARYLGGYVDIHKMYVSSEGYQILIRVRKLDQIMKKYNMMCRKKSKPINQKFKEEPWRIISEQMRIFGSVFAKWINANRDRSGGLVKARYGRYYFSSHEEFQRYCEKMESCEQVRSQQNEKYQVSEHWIKRVKWVFFRGVEWVESLMNKPFKNDVVLKLIHSTKSHHSFSP